MVSSASVPGRPRSRYAAGLPAVTADGIIKAAMRLTSEHGVETWTLRQLASAMDAYPAVVYHHVGDREAVVRAVVDRVVGLYPLPPEDLPWRDWFRELLRELRVVLRQYPGVARRLSLYGPTVSAAAETVDRGVRILQRAGFGEESPLVYRVLLSSACQFLSVEDDQERNVDTKLRNGELWSTYRNDPDRPGLAAMGASVHELLQDPERRTNYFADLYDYAIERCLDGLAARLDVLRGR